MGYLFICYGPARTGSHRGLYHAPIGSGSRLRTLPLTERLPCRVCRSITSGSVDIVPADLFTESGDGSGSRPRTLPSPVSLTGRRDTRRSTALMVYQGSTPRAPPRTFAGNPPMAQCEAFWEYRLTFILPSRCPLAIGFIKSVRFQTC